MIFRMFQVFYVSHKVVGILWFVALIIHAKSFILWFAGPAIVFLLEKLYYFIYKIIRQQSTVEYVASHENVSSKILHEFENYDHLYRWIVRACRYVHLRMLFCGNGHTEINSDHYFLQGRYNIAIQHRCIPFPENKYDDFTSCDHPWFFKQIITIYKSLFISLLLINQAIAVLNFNRLRPVALYVWL